MSDITLVRSIFGSHLYGTSTPTSDRDYKEVFVPDLETILLNGPNINQNMSTKIDSGAKNTADDVDTERFSLGTFIKHLCDGEMIAVDLMHSSIIHWEAHHPMWRSLWEQRASFYTKDMRAYVGYIRKQVSKYGVKGFRVAALESVIEVLDNTTINPQNRMSTIWDLLPVDDQYLIKKKGEGPNYEKVDFYEVLGSSFMSTSRIGEVYKSLRARHSNYGHRAQAAKENQGIDWKAVSHAFRACYQLIAIYEDGGFKYPLPDTKQILEVKMGLLDYKAQVEPELEILYDKVQILAEKSSYPQEVDPEFRRKVQLDIYKQVLKGQFH